VGSEVLWNWGLARKDLELCLRLLLEYQTDDDHFFLGLRRLYVPWRFGRHFLPLKFTTKKSTPSSRANSVEFEIAERILVP
jgi:hypothetical protein